MERVGVVLLNLGGPATREEIRPFLKRLFSDREIIRLPGGPLLQPLLARLIIRRRLADVRQNYDRIGGGSPILPLTRAQAEGLSRRLRERGLRARVAIAMRYTEPGADRALRDLAAWGAERLLAVTLYPQYSAATTGSSLKELERARERTGVDLPLTVIDRYPEHHGYLQALAETVREGLADGPRDDVVLLFSAHSLPRRFVEEGDPYVDETRATVAGVRELLPPGLPWRLSFQSRAGPVRWVGPDTAEVIRELAAKGVRNVVAVPISFVSDHVETLYEMDLLYGDQARGLGIDGYRRAPAMNDSPAFLDALADLAEEALK